MSERATKNIDRKIDDDNAVAAAFLEAADEIVGATRAGHFETEFKYPDSHRIVSLRSYHADDGAIDIMWIGYSDLVFDAGPEEKRGVFSITHNGEMARLLDFYENEELGRLNDEELETIAKLLEELRANNTQAIEIEDDYEEF